MQGKDGEANPGQAPAGDNATRTARWETSFYQMPAAEWSAVDGATLTLLTGLAADLTATVRAWSAEQAIDDPSTTAAGASGAVLAPAALALRLGEAAGQVFSAITQDEADLRQIIATMRTALALCWDMYSADETGRVSVRQHMERLQESITEFEEDLRLVQEGRA